MNIRLPRRCSTLRRPASCKPDYRLTLTEEEEDLLDLAYGLTHTSRLGCQIKVTRDMEEMIVKLPSATRNFYVDKKKLNLDLDPK